MKVLTAIAIFCVISQTLAWPPVKAFCQEVTNSTDTTCTQCFNYGLGPIGAKDVDGQGVCSNKTDPVTGCEVYKTGLAQRTTQDCKLLS